MANVSKNLRLSSGLKNAPAQWVRYSTHARRDRQFALCLEFRQLAFCVRKALASHCFRGWFVGMKLFCCKLHCFGFLKQCWVNVTWWAFLAHNNAFGFVYYGIKKWARLCAQISERLFIALLRRCPKWAQFRARWAGPFLSLLFEQNAQSPAMICTCADALKVFYNGNMY